MSNAKIISIMDHEVARSRAQIDETLTRLQLHLSVELADIRDYMGAMDETVRIFRKEIDELREDVDKLREEMKQGGGLPLVK